MFQIALSMFRINFKNTVLTTFLLTVVFYMTCISVGEYIQNKYAKDYVHSLEDSLYYLPDSPGQIVGSEHDVGTVQMSIPSTNGDISGANACWHVNELYSRTCIHNIIGSPLNFQNGRKEVLLYGRDLQKRYSIGETVSLDHVDYTVVGYVSTKEPLYDLRYHFLGEDMVDQSSGQGLVEDTEWVEGVLQYPINGNMYLTNDGTVAANTDHTVTGDTDYIGFIINGSLAKQYSSADIVSMKEIKKLLLETIEYRGVFHMLSILLLLGMAIFVMLSMSIIQYRKSCEYMGVYRLCGMRIWKYHLLSVANWIISILTAFVFDMILYVVFSHSNREDVFFYPVQFIGMMAGVSIVIVCILNLWIQQKAVIDLLKTDSST